MGTSKKENSKQKSLPLQQVSTLSEPRLRVIKSYSVPEFINKFKKELDIKPGSVSNSEFIRRLIPHVESKLSSSQAVYYRGLYVDIIELTFQVNISAENYVKGADYLKMWLGDLNDFVEGELKDRPKLYECSEDPLMDYARLISLMQMIENKYADMKSKYSDKQIALFYAPSLMGMNFIMVDGFVYQLFLSQLQILCKKFEVELDIQHSIQGAVNMFSLFIPFVGGLENKSTKTKKKK